MAPGTARLSRRGDENVASNEHWQMLTEALSNAYDKHTNPTGAINLGVAESNLMHKELTEHMLKSFDISSATHLTYGSGPAGSPRLQQALSSFFNTFLRASPPTQASEFIMGSGLSSVVDMLAWCLCNEGEGMLVPQPLYTGFEIDLPMRSRARLLPVPFAPASGSYDLNVLFDPAANRAALTAGLARARAHGVAPRAVILCNPHNPLGRCYPESTIREIARFCAEHDLHLVSDEIYAASVFDNPDKPDAEPFRSVLAMDLSRDIAPELVHMLYGMSKDFCANGMRVGTLHSRNERLRAALASIAVFAWPSYVAQDRWAALLEDGPFLQRFMRTNAERLGQAYGNVVRGLDKRGIPMFRGGNAGFFVWIDLSRWLVGPDGEAQELVLARHDRFLMACLRRGVFVRHGYHFYTERPGWVRITFTLDGDELELGLDRMMLGLEDFAAQESTLKAKL